MHVMLVEDERPRAATVKRALRGAAGMSVR